MTEKISFQDAEVTIHLFGAHIVSWTRQGREMLFLSRSAVFDKKKAIRGGVPLCFPAFGAAIEGLPSHGFARISNWRLKERHTSKSQAQIIFELTHKDIASEMRKAWDDNKFLASYTVTLERNRLTTNLTVKNVGSEIWSAQALLHTYFRVPNISSTRILGLGGQKYYDQLREKKKMRVAASEEEKEKKIEEETDRIFVGPLPDVNIRSSNTEDKCTLSILVSKRASLIAPGNDADAAAATDVETKIPCDVVLWNPWIAKSKRMSDLADDEYHTFVCVEPGIVIKPVPIKPGAFLRLAQCLCARELRE